MEIYPGQTLKKWVRGHAAQLLRALDDFRSIRPFQKTLTVTTKLKSSSRSREAAIVRDQVNFHNMRVDILEDLREDTKRKQAKPDGACTLIAAVLQAQAAGKTSSPTQLFREMISARYSRKPGFTTVDFPLTYTERRAVFASCAQTLWKWYLDITASLETQDKTKPISTVNLTSPEQIYAYWMEQFTQYEKAAATPVPFGRHRGETFAQAGKGNIRWLRSHLFPEDVITRTLKAVTVLLNPKSSPSEIRTAKRVPHPYKKNPHPNKRKPKRQRSLRVRWQSQKREDLPGKTVTLGTLKPKELARLYRELREQQLFVTQYTRMKAAVEIFLGPRPPRYPTIPHAPSADELLERHTIHYQALSSFRKPVRDNRPDSADRLEKWERKAAADELRAEGQLHMRKLRPLTFSRTMRPPEYTASGVLFDRRNYQFVLAIETHGQNSPKNDGNLAFANFPETLFEPPESKSLLLFPIACGQYHVQLLHAAVGQAQTTQRNQSEQTGAVLDQALPKEVPIGQVELSTYRNDEGHIEIYAHIPVDIAVPPCNTLPTSVMGIHEDEDGRYSYAVMSLIQQTLEDGRQIEVGETIIMGDIKVPFWVDPIQTRGQQKDKDKDNPTKEQTKKAGEVKKPEPDHYVFNIVAEMLAIAQRYNAYIGIEDTKWKKAEASESKSKNRRTHQRPSVKVVETLQQKSLLAGMIEARSTHSVSPHNDCGCCGGGLKKKVPRIQPKRRIKCPICSNRHLTRWKDSDWVYCSRRRCETTWRPQEYWFTCERCKAHLPARYNTAQAVAWRTMEQLLIHHERWWKKKFRGILSKRLITSRRHQTLVQSVNHAHTAKPGRKITKTRTNTRKMKPSAATFGQHAARRHLTDPSRRMKHDLETSLAALQRRVLIR